MRRAGALWRWRAVAGSGAAKKRLHAWDHLDPRLVVGFGDGLQAILHRGQQSSEVDLGSGEDVLAGRECDGVLTSRPLQPTPDHTRVPLDMARGLDERLAKIEQRPLGIAHRSCGRARKAQPRPGNRIRRSIVERVILHLG